VTRIRAAHNFQANRRESKLKHVECSSKQIWEDEQCVQDLVICLHEFNSYPINPSSPVLHTLQSAIPASDKLAADFNSAYVVAAEEKLTTFLQDRVFIKKISLHEHVPLNKRLTFAKESSNEKPTEWEILRWSRMLLEQLSTWLRAVNLWTFQSCWNIVLLMNVFIKLQ